MKKSILYLASLLIVCSCTPPSENTVKTTPPKSTKPILFALKTIDIDSSAQWYIENLGFELLKKDDYPDYNMSIAFLKTENVMLELVASKNTVRKDSIEKATDARIAGLMKMGFATDRYEYLYKKLKSHEVNFLVDTLYDENMDSHYFIVYDHEHNPIQLFSTSNHYDQSKELTSNDSLHLTPHLMAVFTDSIELSKSWYETNLGFEDYWSKEIPEYSVKVEILQLENFNLELLELKNVIDKSSVLPDSINTTGLAKVSFLSNRFDSLYTHMTNSHVNLFMDSTKSSSDWAKRHYIASDDNDNLIQIME